LTAQTANQHRLNILRCKYPRRARIKRRIDLDPAPKPMTDLMVGDAETRNAKISASRSIEKCRPRQCPCCSV
jgi:hypothetical protein